MAKPDFTGTWTFNPAKSALQIEPPDATRFVVHHQEPSFRIERTHIKDGASDSFTLELTTDGKDVSVTRDGLQLVARAYWDELTLVFETQIQRAGVRGTNVVLYKLAADGLSIVAEEHFRSATLNYDNVWVMERAPA